MSLTHRIFVKLGGGGLVGFGLGLIVRPALVGPCICLGMGVTGVVALVLGLFRGAVVVLSVSKGRVSVAI